MHFYADVARIGLEITNERSHPILVRCVARVNTSITFGEFAVGMWSRQVLRFNVPYVEWNGHRYTEAITCLAARSDIPDPVKCWSIAQSIVEHMTCDMYSGTKDV